MQFIFCDYLNLLDIICYSNKHRTYVLVSTKLKDRKKELLKIENHIIKKLR
jgi:hypothetical protein